MNQRRVLDGVKDFLHGIGHRQNKAGRELAQRSPGIHQCGRVGQKVQICHQVVKFLGCSRCVGLGIKDLIGRSYGVGHPVKQSFHRLGGLSVLIPN